MLRKTYLVPTEDYRPSPPNKRRKHPHHPRHRRRQRPKNLHPQWIKLRNKRHEAELPRNAGTKEVADYDILYDIFNCHWVDTRWQQYSTH